MKIAFPTQNDQGLHSTVYGHFGSAACFVIVDTATGSYETVVNADAHHLHGNCQPLKALGDQPVQAVVVGGIGGGALRKLMAAGIHTYRAVEGSVIENLDLIKARKLPMFTLDQTCGGHNAECTH
jgi:predicted Fe-Mo cluster-binding NifX family protein